MNAYFEKLMPALRALRVYQWPKNLFVFPTLVFARQMHDVSLVLRSLAAFVVFCAASSATYIFNDMVDVDNDRAHPEKCRRPLASGALSMNAAAGMTLVLGAGALISAYVINVGFFGVVAFYMVMTGLYTIALKHIVIIDVMIVAAGFVVRAMGGAVALQVEFSNWLMVCTLFLALFMALSKRRHEVASLRGDTAGNHRAVLQFYSLDYLDQLIVVVMAGTVITYTIYTCSPEVVERLGTDKLYLTLPFVIYGLFRYLHLVHFDEKGGDPSQTLLQDWPLCITALLYGLVCVGIIYGSRML
ncbi:MAG TPA: decaprenyl-phosphate phosphoribosyltransferase [Candidatus Hydrogenedentes bacterium]|nr:decaprenyl-phosphate phosphoribosyltransferase [Candidatus Hydrogenedentota bacterium]